MSFFSFNIMGNALDAFQEAQNVTADNISNVSTPGASRQSADITEAVPISGSPFYAAAIGAPSTQGEGAVVAQITRIHADSYDSLFRAASSSQYYYTAQQQQLTNLQNNFGEPNNGVNSAYSALQTAVSNVAASPTSIPVRNTVLTAAGTFTNALNTASSALTNQETSVIAQGTTAVQQANGYIDQIASLNGQIRALTAAGDNPNTYLDQRDYAIDELSQIVPTTTALQANGSALVTIDGRAVVSDTVTYHLAAPVVATGTTGVPALVVGFAGDPNPINPAPIPLGSAQLGALTDLYNNKLLPYGQQLDAVASAAASEMNRISQAGVDANGNGGGALFTAGGNTTVTAADISVGITNPLELPVGLISTAAGSLTKPMNSANNTVATSAPIDGNATLTNPPPTAGLTGSLTIAVDGSTQTFSYDTAAGGNSATIGGFMTSFNAGHYGVTASFDPATQRIVFARDPSNTDAIHRALQGANAATPGFTITDSQIAAGTTSASLTPGTPAAGLLEALGATDMSGVAQTTANAYGSADNGAANALLNLFTTNVGAGALQTTAATVSTPATGSVTIGEPSAGAYATVNVGQQLTIVHDPGLIGQTQQTVTVTGVNRANGTITVDAGTAVYAGDALATAPEQTLGATYQSLITQMGLDAHTAVTGMSTQSSLAATIDSARQSVDGINIDEETQNLLKYQNAYNAAAKTLSTLNTMMQTTLNLISGG